MTELTACRSGLASAGAALMNALLVQGAAALAAVAIFLAFGAG